MARRLDAPTGIIEKLGIPSGIFQIIWKDTNAIIFKDANNVIWRDRSVDLTERLTGIEGLWEKQTKPVDGATKLSRPSGSWIKQNAPA